MNKKNQVKYSYRNKTETQNKTSVKDTIKIQEMANIK